MSKTKPKFERDVTKLKIIHTNLDENSFQNFGRIMARLFGEDFKKAMNQKIVDDELDKKKANLNKK